MANEQRVNPLAGLSREEILEETTLAAIENRTPFADRIAAMRTGTPAAVDPGDEEIFSAADLTGASLAGGEEYPVPGTGKKLWIFGLSSEDLSLMVAWSSRPEPAEAGEDPAELREQERIRSLTMQQELQVYQTILCCRRGPTRAAKRCFSRADYQAVKNMLGYAVVREIAGISDRLSGSDETLGPGVRRFFTRIQSVLRRCSGASAGWDGCPPGLSESLTGLASLVSRALTRGALDSTLLSELREG